MLNNFIGGGQVFLHKIRMFSQVFKRALFASLFIGIGFGVYFNINNIKKEDWNSFASYRKALLTIEFDKFFNDIRESIGKNSDHVTYINAHTKRYIYEKMDPEKIARMSVFRNADERVWKLAKKVGSFSMSISLGCFVTFFILWSYFGSSLSSEKKKKGSAKLLTAREVKWTLWRLGKRSHLRIGKMPLVKDMETRHFLISGSTGSGKTNLIHNMLPQVEKKGQPAIVIDQTGEMIAKYYNEARGDIIFNPFDSRSKAWDFWYDCQEEDEIERFAKILFSFNRKKYGSNSDVFWENSAEMIFTSCVNYLNGSLEIEEDAKDKRKFREAKTMRNLSSLTINSSIKTLKMKLIGTLAARILQNDNAITANSILSVLSSTTKPLKYLKDDSPSGKFSLKKHFRALDNEDKTKNKPWLFFATKPSNRELTLPIISCLTDLALSMLMERGPSAERRVWFVIDELAALGKLPALNVLMAEGRKYGACVVAGLQSLNQLYANYDRNEGEAIFGQFGTSFYFRNNEPSIASMVSRMCGTEVITKKQKSTSYGANSYRDGQGLTEQERTRNIVEYNDLASLQVGECYVLMPEPKVRLAKITVPYAKMSDKSRGFKELDQETNNNIDQDDFKIENLEPEEDKQEEVKGDDGKEDDQIREQVSMAMEDEQDKGKEKDKQLTI